MSPPVYSDRYISCALQDQATEVIMTLGQAFEVAYQMALKDQLQLRGGSDCSPDKGHGRSMSISGPTSGPTSGPASSAAPDAADSGSGSKTASVATNGVTNGATHVRSKSCGEHPAPKLVLTEDL